MTQRQDVVQGLLVPLTPLIGRVREVDAVCSLLRRDGVRLVTLIGPGGVGKTRLALAVAEALAGDFADGVRVASLGAVSDPVLLGPAIAQAIGIREAGTGSLLDQLAGAIAGSDMLLVLDSAEAAAEGAAFITGLLAACPGLKVLVTSRLVLHLTAEHLYPVPPLIVPDLTPDLTSDRLAGLDAVQLFAQRAGAADAGFVLGNAEIATVAAICRRLDGLPLAIELAAARSRFFPPATLLARLEPRLPLLTGGPQDAPERHRTLRAAIAWSYDLLHEPERQVLRRLAVFAGGCTIDAALDVAGCDEPAVAVLVDHSLLNRVDLPGEEVRFAMLDTVREFAFERLAESGESEDLRRAHAAWCEELASAAEAALGTSGQQGWLRRLAVEHDNLRAALQAARRNGDHATMARLARGLWRFWYALGFFAEGRLWVDDAMAATDALSASERLDLLIGAGTFAHAQGDEERAFALTDEALTLARQEDDRRGLALALNLRGVIARDHGDYERAQSLLEESLDLSRSLQNRWGIVLSINSTAILHQLRGDYERAASTLEEAAAMAAAQGDTWGTAQALSNMAHLSRRQGDFDRAAELYAQSGALYREMGDRRGEANSLTNLGRIAERLGEIDRAIDLHGQSLAAAKELGDRRGASTALANLGLAYLRREDFERAGAAIRESLAIRNALGDQEGVATSLEKLAEVAAGRGQAERALRLWAAAAASRDAIGAPLAPSERASYDIVIMAARAVLPEERIAAAWAEARSIPVAETIAFALRDEPPPSLPRAGEASRDARPSPDSGLTTRELDVLRLLEIHTDREIADQLFIGPRTVATHVTNILNKLGVNSRTAAVAYAIRRGFI